MVCGIAALTLSKLSPRSEMAGLAAAPGSPPSLTKALAAEQ